MKDDKNIFTHITRDLVYDEDEKIQEVPHRIRKKKRKKKPSVSKFKDKVKNLRQNEETFDDVKNNKIKSKKKHIAFISVCVIFAIILLFFNTMSPTGIIEYIKVSIAQNGSGDGFDTPIQGGRTEDLVVSEDLCFVLTDSALSLYNIKGKNIDTRPHGFAQPCVKTSKIRTLIYDKNGKKFNIETAEKTVFQGEIDNEIFTAAIANNGNYAFITDSDSHSSELSVYDKSNKKIFRWQSAAHITSADFGTSGAVVYLTAISSENASIKTTVLKFDLNKEEPEAVAIIPDECAVQADASNKNKIFILTDKSVIIYDKKLNETEKTIFGAKKLKHYNFNSVYGLAFSLTINNDDLNNEIYSYNTSGEQNTTFKCDYSVTSVANKKNKVLVLSPASIYEYSLEGNREKETGVLENPITLKVLKNTPVVVSSGEIKKYE